MKKIAKIFAIIACIATFGMMTSCSKDNADLIIGKWKWVSATTNGETQTMPDGYTWEFTEAGKLISVMNYETPQTIQYSVEKDIITFTSGNNSFTVTIKELDKEKLVVDMGNLFPQPNVVVNMTRI